MTYNVFGGMLNLAVSIYLSIIGTMDRVGGRAEGGRVCESVISNIYVSVVSRGHLTVCGVLVDNCVRVAFRLNIGKEQIDISGSTAGREGGGLWRGAVWRVQWSAHLRGWYVLIVMVTPELSIDVTTITIHKQPLLKTVLARRGLVSCLWA